MKTHIQVSYKEGKSERPITTAPGYYFIQGDVCKDCK